MHVCNWITHLQLEWQTTCHTDNSFFTVHQSPRFQLMLMEQIANKSLKQMYIPAGVGAGRVRPGLILS